jgi:hypothetical protein
MADERSGSVALTHPRAASPIAATLVRDTNDAYEVLRVGT